MIGGIRDAVVRTLTRFDNIHTLRLLRTPRQDMYAGAYIDATWDSQESGSGTGSELRATETIRARLPGLLERLGATSLLDAPCGDWNWMRHVDLPVARYHGADIVSHVIARNQEWFSDERHSFLVADLTADPLPRADVVLCRDCLVHVSFQDAAKIIENFRRTGAAWLLLNTYPEVQRNRNQFTGANWRRLNFRLPPFSFPPPLETMPDGGTVDPSQLALWRLDNVPPVSG